ncbi:MAG: hypothetical protein QXE01_10110 [Sulfolobales archaeon]
MEARTSFKDLFRAIVETLMKNDKITDLDLEYLASRGFDTDDIDVIVTFLKNSGIVEPNSECRCLKLVNRRFLEKIAEILRKAK